MEKYYTILQLEPMTDIPHPTIRRYIERHGHHLKMKKKHKTVLVAEESVKTLIKIRMLYADRLTIEDVDNALATQGIPVTIQVETDDEKQIKMDLSAVMTMLSKQQEEFHKEQMEMMESNKAEIMMKQEQDKKEILNEIKRIEKERDEKFVKGLKEVLESKKEAASEVEKKWWKVW